MAEEEKQPSFLVRWLICCFWPGFGYALMSTCLLAIPMLIIGFSRDDIQTLFMFSIPAWGYYWASQK
jgi:hypothetical protein|nr:MAG: hypothetical protein DIU57_17925 [Pseudomonadota bacterium]